MKYSHLALVVSLSILSACANKSQTSGVEADPGYVAATQSLNDRRYPEAISALEDLKRRYPESREIRRKLMHAHAGLAGFEAATFKEKIERLADKADKYKGKSLSDEYESFRREFRASKNLDSATLQKFRVYRVTGELRAMLDDLPTLSKEQFSHLNQAIRLYDEMSADPAANSPDDNFRWGTLHAFRIVMTTKYMVACLDDTAKDLNGQSRADLERMLISAADQMWSDSLSAYKLFKNSYAKLRTVSEATDRFVQKVTGSRVRTELLDESRDVSDVLATFAADNKELSAKLVSRLEEFAETSDIEGTLKRAFSEVKEENPEVQYRKMRIRAITQIFIDNLKEKRGADLQEGKYLTKAFFRELGEAFQEAKRVKRLAPIQELLRNERGELHRIAEIGRLLLNDAKEADLAGALKSDVVALRDLVDREQLLILKSDGQELAREAKAAGAEYRARLIELTRITEERLRARGKSAENLLSGELGEEYREFRASLGMKDGELNFGVKKQKEELKEMGK